MKKHPSETAIKIMANIKLFHRPSIIKGEVLLSPSFLRLVNVREVIISCQIPINKKMNPNKYLI